MFIALKPGFHTMATISEIAEKKKNSFGDRSDHI